jgi:short-subunit dehydrogenase
LETEKYNINTLIVCPGKIKTNVSHNAVTARGEKHNEMDPSHENALSAEDCAKQIITGLRKNKEEIYIGGKEISLVHIKRLLPKLFAKLVRKQSPF